MKQIRTVLGVLAIVVFVGVAVVIIAQQDTSVVSDATGVENQQQPIAGPALHDPSTLMPGTENTGIASGTTAGSTTTPAGTYTMAEVASHNSAQSCWTVIRGQVFDLTTWINRHPGGPQAIIMICGVDGTVAFDNQHEGQGRPEQILASFKIGILQ